ncbi:MAG: hypothetical protein JOZ47_09590 [Kutzneria sp.]|nr:hypothetical protein [Kutzneria sp.]
MALRLDPVPLRVRPVRRLPQLVVGLVLYGASMGLQIRANLGLDPWDVLHQGLTRLIGVLSFGTVTQVVGLAVLLCWIPLRQRPGFGTVANIVLIGFAVDATLAVLPALDQLVSRAGYLVASIVLNGVASATYVGARLGPGPRDGLMTGLYRRTGWSLRLIRTAIEVAVLLVGALLGGTVGIGTVLYAVSIGPLTQFFLRWSIWKDRPRATNDITDAADSR